MANQFAKCPTWWIRNGILAEEFKGGRCVGESIAGLKCIIAIAHNVNFYTLEAELSYDALGKATGLSRPMISKGLSLIENCGIVKIERLYRNKYTLLECDDDDKWAKIPLDFLKKELSSIPNRGRVTLFALKFYLQLLADRPNKSTIMYMTYGTIRDKVGTQQRDIKPSIDMLFIHNLISVAKSEDQVLGGGKVAYKKNEYTIRGIAV